MNILPLVSAFLLILSIGSAMLFKERVTTLSEERSIRGYRKAVREAFNKVEQTHFEVKRAEPKEATEEKPVKEKVEKEKRILSSSRDLLTYPEKSKLNISPLFQEPKTEAYKELYEMAARLIFILYQEAPFFKKSALPNLQYQILDAMIAKGFEKKEIATLSDLFPEDPLKKALFYKMIKGTQKSYPALGSYITLQKSNKSPLIYFHSATLPVLAAFFGEKTAQQILDKEASVSEKENKTRTLNKAELQTLAMEKKFSYPESLVSFSKKREIRETIHAQDSETGIQKKLPISSQQP